MRNPSLEAVKNPYLFATVTKQAERHPNPVDLGVGDTSLPLADCVVEALRREAPNALRYGPEHGLPQLRARIAECFYPMLSPDEIFISDGVKTDIGRIHALFDDSITIGLQDPTYPTYREAALIAGKSRFVYLPCHPENNFFPEDIPPADLMIICSPCNPTGYALSRLQLTRLIEAAHRNGSLILFDAAYAAFVSDPTIPRTLFELDGAKEVVIELNSFSKLAGFTGLRLGWSALSKSLKYPKGGLVHGDWARVISTYHNGSSRLVQAAGLAALSLEGQRASAEQVKTYHRRAKCLKEGLSHAFPTIYGAEHAPYLWIPTNKRVFEQLGIITIAGEGFGPGGKGFTRLSAFSAEETIEEAISRCMPLTALSLI